MWWFPSATRVPLMYPLASLRNVRTMERGAAPSASSMAGLPAQFLSLLVLCKVDVT